MNLNQQLAQTLEIYHYPYLKVKKPPKTHDVVGELFNKQNHHGWSDCEISVLYFCSVNPDTPNDINQSALKIRKRFRETLAIPFTNTVS